MYNITEDVLLDACLNYATYAKGKQYFKNRRVKLLVFNNELNVFDAIVSGSKNYKVMIEFDSEGEIVNTNCTCPAYQKYEGVCKHVVATLLEIESRYVDTEYERRKSEATENILNFFDDKEKTAEKLPIKMDIIYQYGMDYYNHSKKVSYLSMRIGRNQLYVVKDLKNFLDEKRKGEIIYFGKSFTFDPNKHKFKDEDKVILDLIEEIYDIEQLITTHNYISTYRSLFREKRVRLSPNATKRFFEIVKTRKISAIVSEILYKNISVVDEDIEIDFLINKWDKDLLLEIENKSDLIPLTEDYEYFFTGRKINRISEYQKKNLIPFYKLILSQRNRRVEIPRKDSEKFISEVYPSIERIGNVEIDEKVKSYMYKPEFVSEIYLDRNGNKIVANVKFIYGDIVINPFAYKERKNDMQSRILIRDINKEKDVISFLENSEFTVKNEQIYLQQEEKIYEFIYYELPKLQHLVNVYYSDSFKNMKMKNAISFFGGVRLNEDNDMLEFDFGIKGIENSELVDIFSSLREKKRYFRLKNGSFLPLDMKEFYRVAQMMDYLDLSEKDLERGKIEIPKFRALYLDEHIEGDELQYINRDLSFRELVQKIKEPGNIEYEIPKELDEILRDYQQFGYKWLKTLSAYGLGGILADDMGLGKTLQILTLISSEIIDGKTHPSLIVAPTSLVYNWFAEIKKFTPNIKALIIIGNKKEREVNIENAAAYDIVITSYALIRRDIELYQDISFKYCILDEAQHIKNATSQNAKSVKRIKANNYFALTGTPIENSLIELWSIFDFVMPGYLLSHTKFRKKFEKPIIKDKDKIAAEELRKHIAPFILRRLKKDVLKELPEKIEHKIIAELSEEQKKIYLAYLMKIKGEIEEEIKDKGFSRSHIKILAGLTRLRQICCHPALFIDNFDGESGKLQLLEEIIDEAIDGEHRILLFSQFTSMLKIIKEMLDDKNIEYQYLDGSTDAKKRGDLVNEFNEGKGKIFLISLRAGGTGLNLTGADTVIHFDPWWNPAVEEQATDRAHRIGQQKSVHVIKLITKGTIEEKIFKLQEKKRKMIDSIIKPGETLVSKMSEEEMRDIFEIE